MDAAGAHPEVENDVDSPQDPCHRHRWVERHDQAVVQELHGVKAPKTAPEITPQYLEGPARPACLLAEVVGPVVGALAVREDIGGVDRLPTPARERVARAVEVKAGGH